MSFYLYHKSNHTYTKVSSVRLTGPNGVLARFLQARAAEDTPFGWEMPMAQLMPWFNPDLDASEHALVIDMLPESFLSVSLYQVTDIRGSSDYDETDLVIACQLLYQGKANTDIQTFKNQFTTIAQPDPRQMVEALRLTGGTREGTYRWTKPKMDIGAAVCPAKKIA